MEDLDLDQTNLEWQTFDDFLPDGAVSIYNYKYKRTDYVAKYKSLAGFYNPDMGPYCLYPYYHKEHRGTLFEILVNKDNFELLEWEDGSHGSVPPNAVYTSPNDIYVGKNEYGLGKVHLRHSSFFLPCEGKEHCYKYYQVLTVNRDVISEEITDVKYKTAGVQVSKGPPETMDTSVITNRGCSPVTGTATLSKMSQVEQRWDTSFSFSMGATTSITAEIPLIGSTKIEYSVETTLQFTKGTTHTESKTHTLSVEHTVPPKHSCTVTMVGQKYQADIPYTARLRRTYRNGNTTWTSISGTYKGVQMGEVCALVNPCEPLSVR